MGKRKPRRQTRRRRRVTKRDEAALRLTADFGLLTFDAIQRLIGKETDATKSMIRRLTGSPEPLLRSSPLDAKRVYYQLTHHAANLLGVPAERAKPLGIQSVIRRYALLWFICLDDVATRWICNPRDYPQFFDLGNNRLPQANFYLEQGGDDADQTKMKFGYVLVDHDAHHRRILQRAIKHLRRFLTQGWFDDLIASRSFELTILTITNSKKRSIQAGLDRRLCRALGTELSRLGLSTRHALPIPISIHVVPGLIDIIPGR